jgi:hypothetical protein
MFPPPGCCVIRCYAPVSDPPFPPDTCLEIDGGQLGTDGGLADAGAGICLPGADPQTAALLGNPCLGAVLVQRDGWLTTDDAGAPSCCYPVQIVLNGRPLPVAGMNRVAPLCRTSAWT